MEDGKLQDIISGILDVASKVAPLILPGAPAAIAAGRSLIELIDNAKDVVAEKDQGVLQARRDEIEQRVNAHADRTIGSLG